MFKLNNLVLALDMALKFYTSVAKGLKLKVRKLLRLIFMFAEVTREKLVGKEGRLLPPPPPILNRLRVLAQIKRSVKHCSVLAFSDKSLKFVIVSIIYG